MATFLSITSNGIKSSCGTLLSNITLLLSTIPIGPKLGVLKAFKAIELALVTSEALFNSPLKQTKTPLFFASSDAAVHIEAAKLAGPSYPNSDPLLIAPVNTIGLLVLVVKLTK